MTRPGIHCSDLLLSLSYDLAPGRLCPFAVRSICLSATTAPDGADPSMQGLTLYSGGEEGVLLVWRNLRPGAAAAGTGADAGAGRGATAFFPRLGAPVTHVASSGLGTLLLVTTDR